MLKVLYSDLNSYTPLQKPLLTNIESIYSSIYDIITTPIGTRLFNRRYGCDITKLPFDIFTDDNIELALYMITNAIESFEPRVVINNKTTIVPDELNNKAELYLFFSVKGLSEQEFTFNATLSK